MPLPLMPFSGGKPSKYPTLVGFNGTANTGGGSGAKTTALPAGIAAGDMLIIAVYAPSLQSNSPVIPSGWTQLTANWALNQQWAIWYKLADGSEGASASWNSNGNTTFQCSCSFAVRGFKAGALPEANVVYVADNSDAPNPPALTPSWGSKKSLFMTVGGVRIGGKTWGTRPSGYTQAMASLSSNNLTNSCQIASDYRFAAVATEDPSNYATTGGGTKTQNVGMTIAMRGT